MSITDFQLVVGLGPSSNFILVLVWPDRKKFLAIGTLGYEHLPPQRAFTRSPTYHIGHKQPLSAALVSSCRTTRKTICRRQEQLLGEGGGITQITQPTVAQDDPRYHFDPHDLDQVQRCLKQRHVQMIAIAGTIGTGLFLGSGKALARAGPAGALLVYIHVGTITYSALCAVGEMTCFAPISGSFPHYAARWVDPAFGFAVGWNYFYTQCITVPVEVTAAQIILTFWDDNHTRGIVYTAIIMVLMCASNFIGVRYFGESEFFFSIIKLALITGLILVGLVIDLGGGPDHDRRGFRYWKNPGAFNTYLVNEPVALGRFLGLIGVLIQAGFSFQGVELVAIAASETRILDVILPRPFDVCSTVL
ncbi:hypothetical protein OPQ81_002486 [Rhizoctonia solani]|nr:hypothetical protein OPQ81_002486 [Rhizoctonia solani]